MPHRFQLAINECPQYSEYHYWAGYTDWYNGNKTKSYPSLVKVGIIIIYFLYYNSQCHSIIDINVFCQ